jgi:hypothetical protein
MMTGELRKEDLAAALEALDDPGTVFVAPPMIAASGLKPLEGAAR